MRGRRGGGGGGSPEEKPPEVIFWIFCVFPTKKMKNEVPFKSTRLAIQHHSAAPVSPGAPQGPFPDTRVQEWPTGDFPDGAT